MMKFDQVSPRERNARRKPACWEVEPEVFFGPADSLPGKPLYTWERRALAVCAGCPVAAACLAEALVHPAAEQHGVVGGMTAGQRQAVMQVPGHGRNRVQRPQPRREILVHLGDGALPARSARPVASTAGGQDEPSRRAAKAG
ncbi:MAG TPA: WhiB family transcriptional regulator [Pseudonocardiaceae bacterium]|nr:WhiB family transcriptional regulator [Pseudonocardiaceae bacterium]